MPFLPVDNLSKKRRKRGEARDAQEVVGQEAERERERKVRECETDRDRDREKERKRDVEREVVGGGGTRRGERGSPSYWRVVSACLRTCVRHAVNAAVTPE